MKALTFTAPHTAQVINRDLPAPQDGATLIAPHYVGLCGTDWELYTGTMPYFTQGMADYPIQPGHEVAGIVAESADPHLLPGTPVIVDPVVGCGDCHACRAGTATHCPDRYELGVRRGMPGGACELLSVPTRNVHPVPDGVALRDAVLTEPGVTAINAVTRLGNATDRRALVIGAGTLGLICTQLLVAAGADVDVLDPVNERQHIVEQAGAGPVTKAADSFYHLVVEAAGTPQAVHDVLAAVAPGGSVALIGVQPAPVDQADLNLVVLKDATVFGVLNGPGLFVKCLSAIAEGSVKSALVIDTEFPLTDVTAALDRLSQPGRARPKVLLRIDT